MGIVENYDFYELEPFFATLRQTRFDGRLCIFAGPNITERTMRRMAGYGAEVIPYGSSFPFIAEPHPKSPTFLPEPIYIFNYRHFLYYDYLLKHPVEFENVLLTDVRDVVFQKDPFDPAIGGRLHVAMENKNIPIGECYYTRSWLLAGYGPPVLERLHESELSCAGTTLGPAPLIIRYLELMLAQVVAMKDAYDCADQAAHNLLLHDGSLEPVTRLYNFEGPILTVGTEPAYRLDDRGRLLNRDGSVIALVHQYDRHAELARLVDRRVRPGAFRRVATAFIFKWKKRIGWRVRKLRSFLGFAPAPS